MTGFGQSSTEVEQSKVSVEIKALNSKFSDLFLKLPAVLNNHEIEIRKLVTQLLERGKINVTIELNRPAYSNRHYDDTLFKNYYERLKSLAESVGDEGVEVFRLALESPDVIRSDDAPITDKEWEAVRACLSKASEACTNFRKQEGESLLHHLDNYADNIERLLASINENDADRKNFIKSKLQLALNELMVTPEVDRARMEQEILYYVEKMDIHEEKVRLGNHLKYFREILLGPSPKGKKLGFISQEMGREINTIGSKANQIDIQHKVVTMKEELEKIKEQVMNVL